MALWDARRTFLEKIEDVAPEVLNSLRDDVFPHYRQPPELLEESPTPVDEKHRPLAPELRNLIAGTADPKVYDSSLQNEQLRTALSAWARRFNLGEAWVLRAATGTLAMWSLGVSYNTWIYPAPGYFFGLTEEERQFAFAHPGWQPDILTRDQIAANTRAAFEIHLKRYLDRIEGLAAAWGLERTSEKRSRWGQDASRHFEWLVRWQVQGWTQKRLRKEFETHQNTIASAIKVTAGAVGLTRRSRKPT